MAPITDDPSDIDQLTPAIGIRIYGNVQELYTAQHARVLAYGTMVTGRSYNIFDGETDSFVYLVPGK